MRIVLAWALLAGLAGLCTYASWIVLRDDLSDKRQKTLQLFLVWLVPGLGAALVLANKHDNIHAGRGGPRFVEIDDD